MKDLELLRNRCGDQLTMDWEIARYPQSARMCWSDDVIDANDNRLAYAHRRAAERRAFGRLSEEKGTCTLANEVAQAVGTG